MTEEHVPVAFADAHAFVHERHVSAPIIHWAARARAEEVDEELLFPHYAILSPMRPGAQAADRSVVLVGDHLPLRR